MNDNYLTKNKKFRKNKKKSYENEFKIKPIVKKERKQNLMDYYYEL